MPRAHARRILQVAAAIPTIGLATAYEVCRQASKRAKRNQANFEAGRLNTTNHNKHANANRFHMANGNNKTTYRAKHAPPPQRQQSNKRARAAPARRITRSNRPSGRGRNIPAAFGSSSMGTFSMRTNGAGSIIVRGQDLVSTAGTTISNNEIITIIPANPNYHTGTKLAAHANLYSTFIPRKLSILYRPGSGTGTNGQIAIGSVWSNLSLGSAGLEQFLYSSPGGYMGPVYQPARVKIPLGANLTQKAYTCAAEMSTSGNPFNVIIAIPQNPEPLTTSPGSIVIEYEYEFRNPCPGSATYTKGIIANLPTTARQAAVLATESAAQYSAGSTLLVQREASAWVYTLDGNIVTAPTTGIALWITQ